MTDKKTVLKDSEAEKVSAGKGDNATHNALKPRDIKGTINFARNGDTGEPGPKY